MLPLQSNPIDSTNNRSDSQRASVLLKAKGLPNRTLTLVRFFKTNPLVLILISACLGIIVSILMTPATKPSAAKNSTATLTGSPQTAASTIRLTSLSAGEAANKNKNSTAQPSSLAIANSVKREMTSEEAEAFLQGSDAPLKKPIAKPVRLIDHFPKAAESGCMKCHSEMAPIREIGSEMLNQIMAKGESLLSLIHI